MQKAANTVIQNTRLLLTQRRIPISELAKVLEIAPEEQEKILQKRRASFQGRERKNSPILRPVI